MTTGWPAEIGVLVPVYNHTRTVGAVVEGCRALGAPYILVVDDGSTDGSGNCARQARADAVHRVEPNRGKGNALRTGLGILSERGFRQVLTIDADLQHPPAEALRLALAAFGQPDAVWLGRRDMSVAPGASRCGCWWTSLWTWIACGVWPGDNQTGLRVYPLPGMLRLPIRAGRYAFEVESLIRAVWGGIAVRSLPVAVVYPADRVSHFDKLRDNLRASWTFTRLVARRCLPWPHQQADGRGAWRSAFSDGLAPVAASRAAALGAAIGVAPIPGFQLAAAAWLALALRQNPAITIIASNISFGPLLAVWFALAIVIGHGIRHGNMAGLGEQISSLHASMTELGAWPALRPFCLDWLVGSLPVMVLAAGIGAAFGWAIAAAWQRRHA